MTVRSWALRLCLLGIPAFPAGCTKTTQGAVIYPEAPDAVSDLDTFAQELNTLVVQPLEFPQRAAFQHALTDFLADYTRARIESGDFEEAVEALQYTALVYEPAELQTVAPHAGVVEVAEELYRRAAREGSETPALFALAAAHTFAPAEKREDLLRRWGEVEDWVVRNARFDEEPLLRHEELQQALEEVAASFPAPLVTQRLTDLYFARYNAARKAKRSGRAGLAAQRRVEITGYLLVRALLRADDTDALATVASRIEADAPTKHLLELVGRGLGERPSARDTLLLAEQFRPDAETADSMPPSFVTQGWGIVANLARRATRAHPGDAFAHMLRAHSLRQLGLTDAAIHHLGEVIDAREDMFEAWHMLAALQQESLASLSARDPGAAIAQLERVETFHRRAGRLWRDRPIEPSLPDAYHTVAEGLYGVGRVGDAQQLLERSLEIEPVPDSLDLLGTIALKAHRFDRARDSYERLAGLSHNTTAAQLRWEARARLQLGNIAIAQGDAIASETYLREALSAINQLLAIASTPPSRRARDTMDRAQVLFALGDIDLAMDDFREAGRLAPEQPELHAQALIATVSHGYYKEATELYLRAMSRDDLAPNLKLYFTLWIRELAIAQGRDPSPTVAAFLSNFQGSDWERALVEHAQGERAYDALLARARDTGERAEAHYYEALRTARSGNKARARELMKKVVATDMMVFFEYDLAQTFLRLGLPAKGTPPLQQASAQAK